MKKLLSLLAAVGLTATAAGSVVACSSSSTTPNGLPRFFARPDGIAHYQAKGITMNHSYKTIDGVQQNYGIFDEKGNLVDANVSSTAPTFEKGQTYDLSYNFHISNYNASKKYHYTFGVIGGNGKMLKSVEKFVPKAEPMAGAKDVVNQVAQTQTFKATNVDASFNEAPTADQLKADFAVKDANGQDIQGVKYSYTPNNNVSASSKFVSFSAASAGSVTIEMPSEAVPEGSGNISIVPDKANVTVTNESQLSVNPASMQEFTEDGVNLSTADLTTNGKLNVITKTDVIKAMSNDTASRAYKALFGKEGTKADLLANVAELNSDAAKGLNINSNDVNSAYNSKNGGVELTNSDIYADGSQYQFALSKDGTYYWFDLSFDQIIKGNVEISPLAIKDNNTVTAKIANDGAYLNTNLKDFNMIKVFANGTQIDNSKIDSANLDQYGFLTLKLTDDVHLSDTVKISVGNSDNKWSDSNVVTVASPTLSSVNIVTATEVRAQISNTNVIEDTTFGIKVNGEKADATTTIDKDTNTVIYTMAKPILGGSTVSVNYNDNGVSNETAPVLSGEPSLSGLNISSDPNSNKTILTANVANDAAVDQKGWTKADVRISAGNGQATPFYIDSVTNDNGKLTVTLNTVVNNGTDITLEVKDGLGDFKASAKAILGTPTVEAPYASNDGKTIYALVSNNESLMNATDLENQVKVITADKPDGHHISDATISDNGVLKITLDDAIKTGELFKVSVKDAMNNWEETPSILCGNPRVDYVKAVSPNLINAYVNDDATLTADELANNKMVKVLVNGNDITSKTDISLRDTNGSNANIVSVKLHDDVLLNAGDVFTVAVRDANNTWKQASTTMFGKTTVSNVTVSDSKVIKANVTGENPKYLGRTLPTDFVKVVVNGETWDSSKVARASLDLDGKLVITLNGNGLPNDAKVQVAVKDYFGNMSELSGDATYKQMQLSNLNVLSDSEVTATLDNANKDALDKSLVVLWINGTKQDSSVIESVTLGQANVKDNSLDIKLADGTIKHGDTIQLMINTPDGAKPSNVTSPVKYGETGVTDLHFTYSNELSVTVTGDERVADDLSTKIHVYNQDGSKLEVADVSKAVSNKDGSDTVIVKLKNIMTNKQSVYVTVDDFYGETSAVSMAATWKNPILNGWGLKRSGAYVTQITAQIDGFDRFRYDGSIDTKDITVLFKAQRGDYTPVVTSATIDKDTGLLTINIQKDTSYNKTSDYLWDNYQHITVSVQDKDGNTVSGKMLYDWHKDKCVDDNSYN